MILLSIHKDDLIAQDDEVALQIMHNHYLFSNELGVACQPGLSTMTQPEFFICQAEKLFKHHVILSDSTTTIWPQYMLV